MNGSRGNPVTCSECGHPRDSDRIFTVDGRPLCSVCLYGPVEPFRIYPIGSVHNDLKRNDTAFGLAGESGPSRIILHPGQRRFMYALEQEKELTIVYYLHESRPVRSRFARGYDSAEAGVFASRTPDRLSRIGIQDVRLVGIEGTTLTVEGLDAVNGTPVLDIKMKKSFRG
ncbi:SAM-dependent methyltransferase [bacterium]|nr:SAM-dependent methyltransferase [bacterium]